MPTQAGCMVLETFLVNYDDGRRVGVVVVRLVALEYTVGERHRLGRLDPGGRFTLRLW